VSRGERPGPPLRARIAAWVAGATAALTLLALAAAFVSVRGALLSDLREALRRDARAVAAAYDGAGDAAAARPGPTGRVRVQLYGPDGTLFAASDPAFERPEAALPAGVVAAAPADWRGRLAGRPVLVAMAPFRLGTVAVLAETGYVGAALAAVGRALALAGALLLALSLPLGWLAARAATRPIRRLARAASRLGPEDLEPLAVPAPRDEVGRLARVLDDLLLRLRAARDEQRRFLAETSHELRTPLTSLRGFLRRARRGAGPAAEADLAHADRIAAGMARLVEDLLELSRGRLVRTVEPHLVDVEQELARPVAHEFEGVRVEPGPSATVLGEPERLRRALRNLVANGVRAAGSDGVVALRWRAAADQVRLEVEDDGPGLPEALREAPFEPFRTGPGGGTGLGLAIARQLVEAHGGRIEVASRPGATVFAVTLPRVEEGEDEAGGAAPPGSP
jgi:hypothetical protein